MHKKITLSDYSRLTNGLYLQTAKITDTVVSVDEIGRILYKATLLFIEVMDINTPSGENPEMFDNTKKYFLAKIGALIGFLETGFDATYSSNPADPDKIMEGIDRALMEAGATMLQSKPRYKREDICQTYQSHLRQVFGSDRTTAT